MNPVRVAVARSIKNAAVSKKDPCRDNYFGIRACYQLCFSTWPPIGIPVPTQKKAADEAVKIMIE